MRSNPFQAYKPFPISFFQKLFKQLPAENALIELNNLFSSKPVRAVSRRDISIIEHKYKLRLKQEFRLNMEEFYAVYLNHCLINRILDEDEIKELTHLRYILALDDITINLLHVKLGEGIYRQSFGEAIADGRLTREEKTFLRQLEDALKLPGALAEKISLEQRTAFMEHTVARVISSRQLSPEEEHELQAISNSLSIAIPADNKTGSQLQKLKQYWALENLALPVINPDIHLQKREVCHLKIGHVYWYEQKGVGRSAVRYGAKAAREFYLQSTGTAVNLREMKQIDTGTLYLTNKRILFAGALKNANILLTRIVDFVPYMDGVEINKSAGKNPTLQISQKADTFCMILERLLYNLESSS